MFDSKILSIIVLVSIIYSIFIGFGIGGYYNIPDKCRVSNRENKTVFRNGEYQQLCLVTAKLDKITFDQSRIQVTSSYWSTEECASIPDVINCYYSGGYHNADKITPVSDYSFGWCVGILPALVGIIFAFIGFGCISDDSIKRNAPYIVSTLPFVLCIFVTGIATLMITGSLGYIDNIETACLITECRQEEMIDSNNHVVNGVALTIMTNYIDRLQTLKHVEYSYDDTTISNCNMTMPIVPCFLSMSRNGINITRIHEPLYIWLLALLVIGIVILVSIIVIYAKHIHTVFREIKSKLPINQV